MSDEETRVNEILARFSDLTESQDPAIQEYKKTWKTFWKTALAPSKSDGACWSRRCWRWMLRTRTSSESATERAWLAAFRRPCRQRRASHLGVQSPYERDS